MNSIEPNKASFNRPLQQGVPALVSSLFCLGVAQGALSVTNLTNSTYDGEAPDTISDLAGNTYRGGFINSALFVEGSVGSGSGQFRDIMRLQGQNNSSQTGYNRDSGGTLDESFLGGNIPLRVSDLQKDRSGNYYVFVMDMNEGGNVNNGLLSFDQFNVWVKPEAGGADPFPSADPDDLSGSSSLAQALGVPAYAMNAVGTDPADYNVIFLDASIQAGSGNSDINIYIPIGNLDAQITSATDYVYVEAAMGGYTGATSMSTNSGHESFSVPDIDVTFVPQTLIPEPSSILLLLAGSGMMFRRKR